MKYTSQDLCHVRIKFYPVRECESLSSSTLWHRLGVCRVAALATQNGWKGGRHWRAVSWDPQVEMLDESWGGAGTALGTARRAWRRQGGKLPRLPEPRWASGKLLLKETGQTQHKARQLLWDLGRKVLLRDCFKEVSYKANHRPYTHQWPHTMGVGAHSQMDALLADSRVPQSQINASLGKGCLQGVNFVLQLLAPLKPGAN